MSDPAHVSTEQPQALLLNHSSASTSPAAIDSPATPVNDLVQDPVKIVPDDAAHPSQEISLKQEILSSAVSNMPEVGSPVDPDTIPVDPPHGSPPPPPGQLLPDVAMAEATESTSVDHAMDDASKQQEGAPAAPEQSQPLTNGHVSHDVPMDALPPSADDAATTSTLVDSASNGSMRRSADRLTEDDEQPPAKRARVHSDADQASLNHQSLASLPPPSSPEPAATPVPSTPLAGEHATAPAETTSPVQLEGTGAPLTVAQWKFCTSTIRSLKKLKDATPFLRPVDPVALNIPHYPTIIKHPMDFGTIDRKLASSNPAKPDPNPENPRYTTAEGFIVDVRRVFSNCVAFNGPDHLVTQMGHRVEAVFDKQIKHLPPPEEPVKPEVKKATPTPPPPPAVKKNGAPTQRRPSTSIPPIRRSEENTSGRPRREIHAPPPKDLPYSDLTKRSGRPKRATRDDGTAEQLRFCSKLLNDLHKKHLWTVASPFYEPVDWQKLDIPSYPKIIKKPMDLGTMRRKLDADEYPNAQKFFEDFKLMIRNCFTFNPVGTPVNLAGVELQKLFDEKWKGLPPLRDVSVSDAYDEDEGDDSEAERQRTIASLESQMEELRQNLAAVRSGASKKKPKKQNSVNAAASSSASVSAHHPKPAAAPAPAVSSSKPKPAKAASTAKAGSKKGKGKLGDDDVLSFDQKKDLSDAIAQLDGQKLERVIQIIHEGVPEIRDSTEEIELEIDSLPATVLTKLYNFVLRPMRAAQSAASGNNPPKRSRAGKSGGTGGLKRKSMDEDVEAEKIRQLEERMRLFDQNADGAGNGAPAAAGGHHSEESDDSSDESSGSESE